MMDMKTIQEQLDEINRQLVAVADILRFLINEVNNNE